MPTLTDYLVLADRFELDPGEIRRINFADLGADYVEGTRFARPILSYVCATLGKTRIIIENEGATIANLRIESTRQDWRTLHHVFDGRSFQPFPNNFIQFRVEDEAKVFFRDVVLWIQRST